MRRIMVSIIALSIAALPASLAAQKPETQRRPAAAGAGMGGNIGERIITQRDQLGLSVEQVAQIRRIQAQLEEQNRPLSEQVRAEMASHRGQLTDEERAQMRTRHEQMRGQMRERMQQNRGDVGERQRGDGPFAGGRGSTLSEEARAAMLQIRENTRQAAQQIHDTLTPEQEAKLRELRPAERRGPAGDAARRGRGGRGAGR
jgi:Spy/CpxP family protein refolding chaperone